MHDPLSFLCSIHTVSISPFPAPLPHTQQRLPPGAVTPPAKLSHVALKVVTSRLCRGPWTRRSTGEASPSAWQKGCSCLWIGLTGRLRSKERFTDWPEERGRTKARSISSCPCLTFDCSHLRRSSSCLSGADHNCNFYDNDDLQARLPYQPDLNFALSPGHIFPAWAMSTMLCLWGLISRTSV